MSPMPMASVTRATQPAWSCARKARLATARLARDEDPLDTRPARSKLRPAAHSRR